MPSLNAMQARLISSVGDLWLTSFRGTEALGRLSSFDVEFVTFETPVTAADIMGTKMAVEVVGPKGPRHFHGIVSRFVRLGRLHDYYAYSVQVVPDLWRLTLSADCRIFGAGDPVLDQVVDLLQTAKVDVDARIDGDKRSVEYFVQYRESDFNFVSRLLEQEGAYYYFEHAADGHKLVIINAGAKHTAYPGYETIELSDGDEAISEWGVATALRSTGYTLGDFNYEQPSPIVSPYKTDPPAVFDYPGGFAEDGAGQAYARLRFEEQAAPGEVYQGSGIITGLATGRTFTLGGDTDTGEYLVTGASYHLGPITYRTNVGTGDQRLHTSFTAIKKDKPFRPARVTGKPRVDGPQTAIVVGGDDDEIATDPLGRIQVKFHWDRSPDTRSCFVRVAQSWAGPQFGALFIPRVGHEVVVSYLDGDPDRPLVTGAVYNGDNAPPWELPAGMTQSGVRSRSTKQGSTDNFNEIRFEDEKGSEVLYVQAEKDESVLIKNDELRDIGQDRKVTIARDDSLDIGQNLSVHVGKDAKRQVDGDENIAITGNRSLTVSKDETVTITGSRTEKVDKNETVSVTGARATTITKDDQRTVNGRDTATIAKECTVNVGKTYTLKAEDQIVLKAGDAQLILKKDGSITVKGKDIGIEGGGSINVKASSDLVLKGSKVASN